MRHDSRALIAAPVVNELQPVENPTSFDTTLVVFAYIGALFVLSVNKFFGGFWSSFLIGLLVVQLTYWLLKINLSHRLAHGIVAARQTRRWPFAIRLFCATLIIGADFAADLYFGGYTLGRSFNLYLLPIFLTSLCLGGRLALVASLLCATAVDYLAIPPRFSFAISSIEDALHLLVFLILAVIVVAIPKVLLASADLAAAKKGLSQ